MTKTTRFLSYMKRVGTALSVLFNVITGGASNQTFSARNYEWQRKEKINAVWIIDLILGDDHCCECWVYWKLRENKW